MRTYLLIVLLPVCYHSAPRAEFFHIFPCRDSVWTMGVPLGWRPWSRPFFQFCIPFGVELVAFSLTRGGTATAIPRGTVIPAVGSSFVVIRPILRIRRSCCLPHIRACWRCRRHDQPSEIITTGASPKRLIASSSSTCCTNR